MEGIADSVEAAVANKMQDEELDDELKVWAMIRARVWRLDL